MVAGFECGLLWVWLMLPGLNSHWMTHGSDVQDRSERSGQSLAQIYWLCGLVRSDYCEVIYQLAHAESVQMNSTENPEKFLVEKPIIYKNRNIPSILWNILVFNVAFSWVNLMKTVKATSHVLLQIIHNKLTAYAAPKIKHKIFFLIFCI